MKRTAQMLIDGCFADAQTNGYLLEGDTIAEMLHNDVLADGRIELGYTLL